MRRASITFLPQSGALLLILAFITVAPAPVAGQGGSTDSTGTGGRHSIQGRIVFPSGKRAEVRLKVRLESSGFGDLVVLSDLNGHFSFRSLTPGNYTVFIEGGDDYQDAREQVFIEPATVQTRRTTASLPIARPFSVHIYLQPRASTSTKPGVIDATLAALPKPAVQLYEKALELSQNGEHAKAIENLKAAIALSPGFAIAMNELGMQYLIVKEIDRAIATLRSAVELAPSQTTHRLNYGMALLQGMRFELAEAELRQVTKMNDAAPVAHMFLGIALVHLKRLDEGEQALEKSISLTGGKLAKAHYYLGGIYWGRRDYKRAATALEKFLELEPKAANAAQVRATIKELRSKS